MNKIVVTILMAILMVTLISCGSVEEAVEKVDQAERGSHEGIIEMILNEDDSLTIVFAGEPYEKLIAEKEFLEMENDYGLSLGARLYDKDNTDLGVVYYDIYSDHEDASYTLDYDDFLMAKSDEGIEFEVAEESVIIRIVSDEIEEVFNNTTYAEITVSNQEFEVVYKYEVEF